MPDLVQVPRTPDERPGGSSWPWWLALAAPFVLCQLVLLATGKTLPAFWANDEYDHLALTRLLADQLPGFDPIYPHSATTPLFHLLGACAVRLFGATLVGLRVLNTAFSMVAVYALYASLRGERGHRRAVAALLTTVFLISCYFFGYSFRWLTDNLALSFCVLAVGCLLRFTDPAAPRTFTTFLWGCLWLSLCILTRQSYLFLGLPFTVVLLTSRRSGREIALGLGAMALAVLPFVGLVFAWHGLVPPAYQWRHTSSLLHLYAVALPLLLLGFYTPFFTRLPLRPGPWREARFLVPAAAALLGLVAVALFPLLPLTGHPERLTYFSQAAREDIPGYFAGWIYRVAGHFPELHGNSLLFWLLLPAGLAVAARFAVDAASPHEESARRVATLFLLGVLLSSTLNPVSAQKYYDPLVLLFFLWRMRPGSVDGLSQRARLGVLILLFCGYFALVTFTMSAASSNASAPSSGAGLP